MQNSDEVINELVDGSNGDDSFLPEGMPLDQQIAVLEKVRRRVPAFSASGPGDLARVAKLAAIEGDLGDRLTQAGRYADAQTVLRRSLGRLDAFELRYPRNERLCKLQTAHLFKLADVSEKVGQSADGVSDLERAIELNRKLLADAPARRCATASARKPAESGLAAVSFGRS